MVDFKLIFTSLNNSGAMIDWRSIGIGYIDSYYLTSNFLMEVVLSDKDFPEFSTQQRINSNDIDAVRNALSSKARVTLTIELKSGGCVNISSTQDLPYVDMPRYEDIEAVYISRNKLSDEWVYKIGSLECCSLRMQLKYLNRTTWNDDWIKLGGGIFQHSETRHRISI